MPDGNFVPVLRRSEPKIVYFTLVLFAFFKWFCFLLYRIPFNIDSTERTSSCLLYTSKDCVPTNAPYNVEKDITFFEGLAETYIAVKPGMFAIFFPQDGHAPGITPDGVKKVIVKVKA